MTIPVTKVAAASAALAATAALAVSAAASAAPATTSGAFQFLGVSSRVNGNTHDVVTGAITDFGADRSLNRNTQKISLRHGSFQIDTTKLNKNFASKANKVGCSGVAAGIGRGMPISHGTGAYAAITGTVTIRATFVQIGKVVNGKCNLNKGVASNGTVIGTGHVSY